MRVRTGRCCRVRVGDYSGPFDPAFDLARLSRQALARLGREYMLVGHVQSRVIMPIVASRYGPEAAADFAIDAWGAASPVFNARTRIDPDPILSLVHEVDVASTLLREPDAHQRSESFSADDPAHGPRLV